MTINSNMIGDMVATY